MKFPRSPYDTLHEVIYLPRMIDKIRLYVSLELPDVYVNNLGKSFDARCCKLLNISYEELVSQVTLGLGDEDIWKWLLHRGLILSEEQIEIWNGFMMKCGWRDTLHSTLERRKHESGCANRTDIQTMFDYIDWDEKRALRDFSVF